MNRTINILKNHSTQFFDLGHFYEVGDFLDEGARNILSTGESISHLAEIESLGEEIFPPGGDSIRGRFYLGSPAPRF